jgi:hypothetical protein
MANDYDPTNNYKGKISEKDMKEMTKSVEKHCEPIFSQGNKCSQRPSSNMVLDCLP